jgi:predicted secreted protein
VLYALIWWVTLFAVLPFGTRPVAEADQATGWRGAPEHPHLWRTVVVTTVVTTLVWGGCMVVILHRDWLSFRTGWLAMPGD